MMWGVVQLKKLVISLLVLVLIAGGLYSWFVERHPTFGGVTPLTTFKSQLTPKQMPLKAVGIGDSLTKGEGDLSEQGYAGIVVSDLRKESAFSSVSFIDEGVTGNTTDDLLKVLQKKNVQGELSQANLIFLTIGGNDIVEVLKQHFLNLNFSEFDKQQKHYVSNLNQILTKVRALNPTAPIYYLGLYNPFEDYFTGLNAPFEQVLTNWNQAGKAILSAYPDTVFVPTFDLFKGKTDTLLYTDHFHPNSKGYHLIAKRLYSEFVNRGKSS